MSENATRAGASRRLPGGAVAAAVLLVSTLR